MTLAIKSLSLFELICDYPYVLNIYSCNNAYADVFQNDFG